MGLYYMGRFLALPANIELVMLWLTIPNTVTNYGTEIITTVNVARTLFNSIKH